MCSSPRPELRTEGREKAGPRRSRSFLARPLCPRGVNEGQRSRIELDGDVELADHDFGHVGL